MHAIILAAGRGERLRPLTDHTPKPLTVVQGKPLLAWHLQHLQQAGLKNIVINVCWLKEMIIEFVQQQTFASLNIQISDEGNKALETGGGIRNALPLLNNKPFLAVSADIFTDFNFTKLPELPEGSLVHLILVDNPKHHPKGDFGLNGNQLTLKKPDQASYTYSGIGIFHPDLFTNIEPGTSFKIAPLIRQAINNNRASAQIHHGQWNDVGTPERLDELNNQQC